MSKDALSPATAPIGSQVAVVQSSAESSDDLCRLAGATDPTLTRDQAGQVADLFKILGDPTRVLILRTLADAGELCVRHLAEAVGMSQSSVSHHLRLLRATALVRARRVGREVYYRPDDEHVAQLIAICADHVNHAGGGREAPIAAGHALSVSVQPEAGGADPAAGKAVHPNADPASHPAAAFEAVTNG